MEKVLTYSRQWVTQDTYYNCGPASAQTVILAATGKVIPEKELATKLRTHRGGTDYIGQFPKVLNEYLPGSGYTHRDMQHDPPTKDEKETLWRDLVGSIDAGRGVVANFVAPPSNYPRSVPPSTISPSYSGGTVYHYVAAMGYAEDSRGRRVWIADSGFYPYGYWIGFDQFASLIPPKGYAYAAAKKPTPPKKETPMSNAVVLGGVSAAALHEAKVAAISADERAEKLEARLAEMERLVTTIATQLLGPEQEQWPEAMRNPNGGRGWPQLGANEEGQWLTPVDALACIKTDVENVTSPKSRTK